MVRAYPRLHLGLLDVSGAGQRAYGGSGFMLDALPIEVSIDQNAYENISAGIDQIGQADIESAVARMNDSFELKHGFQTIHTLPPQHIGLGTKTALLLAVLTAWEQYSELRLTTRQIQILASSAESVGAFRLRKLPKVVQ